MLIISFDHPKEKKGILNKHKISNDRKIIANQGFSNEGIKKINPYVIAKLIKTSKVFDEYGCMLNK